MNLGGHTGEMLRMIEKIDLAKFPSRTWVYTSGDSMSIEKARAYEQSKEGDVKFMEVSRARSVGEGLLSTIKSSTISAFSCLRVVMAKPDLVSLFVLICFLVICSNIQQIITNGPGTSVIICSLAFAFKVRS